MRSHVKPFGLAFSLAALVACASPAGAAQELERVISSEPAPAGVAVTVQTGGCTKKDDFTVSAGPVSAGKAAIELRRATPDNCKGFFPDGLKLEFTWAELKLPEGTQIAVKNPLEPAAKQASMAPVQPSAGEQRRYRTRTYHHRRLHRRHRHEQHWYRYRHREHYCYCPCRCSCSE